MKEFSTFGEVQIMVQRAEVSMRIEESSKLKMEAHGFMAFQDLTAAKIIKREVCSHCKKKGIQGINVGSYILT